MTKSQRPQEQRPLTKEEQEALIKMQIAEEPGRDQTGRQQTQTTGRTPENKSKSRVGQTVTAPSPVSTETPAPKQTQPVNTVSPRVELPPVGPPPVPDMSVGFIVGLSLLIGAGLVMLIMIGKKVYVLIRGN